MRVERNIAPCGRELALIITTEHDGYIAMSAVHRQRHGRRQGGVRFVSDGALAELARLACAMSDKASAANVRADGMKCMIVCPMGLPDDLAKRAAMLEAHVRQAIAVDPAMVFGPDMGCPEPVLDRLAANGLLTHVTGLSRQAGGLDIDANALTAHGLFVALQAAAPETLKDLRVSIQGFGAVGAPLALALHRFGCRVVAVSNIGGALTDHDGLDIPKLFAAWRRVGDRAFDEFCASEDRPAPLDPDVLFSVETDILAPAARTCVLGVNSELSEIAPENPSVRSIERVLRETGVQIICEAANHPLSLRAEEYAESKGVLVLPDIIVNCGGLIGCSYEYEHREALLSGALAYERALALCRDVIADTVSRNLAGLAHGHSAAALRRSAMGE